MCVVNALNKVAVKREHKPVCRCTALSLGNIFSLFPAVSFPAWHVERQEIVEKAARAGLFTWRGGKEDE